MSGLPADANRAKTSIDSFDVREHLLTNFLGIRQIPFWRLNGTKRAGTTCRVWMIGGAGGPGLRRGTIVWCARNTASYTGAAENYSESRRLVFVVGLKLDEGVRGDLQ